MTFDWLKHAFAIEPAGSFEPTAAQKDLVDRLCRQVAARGMVAPALVFLESVRPLNYVTSQMLQFFAPVLSALAEPNACQELASFLEHRGSVEYLCRRMEERSQTGKGAAPPDCS